MAIKKSALQSQCEALGVPYRELHLTGVGRAAEIALPHYRSEGWRGLYGKGNLTWAILRALIMPALTRHHAEMFEPNGPYFIPLPHLLGMMFGTAYATARPDASREEISHDLKDVLRHSFERNPLKLTNDFNIICNLYRATGYRRIPDGLSISEIIDCTCLSTWEGLLGLLLDTGDTLPGFPQLELTNSRHYMVVEVARSGSRLKPPTISALAFLKEINIHVEVARARIDPTQQLASHSNMIIDVEMKELIAAPKLPE